MLEPLKLELFNPETDETRVVKVNFISGRFVRKALKVMAAMDDENVEEDKALDSLVEFVAEIFGIQADEIWDGLDARQLMPTMTDIIQKVMGTQGQADGGPAAKQ